MSEKYNPFEKEDPSHIHFPSFSCDPIFKGTLPAFPYPHAAFSQSVRSESPMPSLIVSSSANFLDLVAPNSHSTPMKKKSADSIMTPNHPGQSLDLAEKDHVNEKIDDDNDIVGGEDEDDEISLMDDVFDNDHSFNWTLDLGYEIDIPLAINKTVLPPPFASPSA